MTQPTGDLGFQTVSITTQPTAALVVSNGIIVYGGGGGLTLATGSNLQNVQLEGVDLILPDGASNITVNQSTIETIQADGAVSNLTVTRCSILGDTEFTSLYVAGVGNDIVIEDNQFGPAHEHIHFVNGTGDNCSISYNHLSGSERHGIESQWHGSNNQFNFNVLDNWRKNPGDNNAGPPTDSHIALSIAMGNDGAVAASGNQVVGNVVDFSTGDISVPLPEANWYLTCGIEYMGNNGLVSGNYIINNGILLYTNDSNFTSQDNVIVGGRGWSAEPGDMPATAPAANNDQLFTWGAANIPARPVSAGPRYPTGYQPGAAINKETPVTTFNVEATNNADGSVSISWTPPAGQSSAVPAIAIASSQAKFTVPNTVAGQSSVRIGGIPQNWIITATVSYPGSPGPTGSASAQITGGPAPTSDTTWTLSVIPPAAAPALLQTIKLFSDGTYTQG